MKVCKHKITGRIIETQFKEDSQVLINNAKQYYPEDDIEIVNMTLQEYKEAIEIQNFNALTYAEKRKKEYPDFREYLDGIVKNDQSQIQKYIDDCLAVKTKYPKT